MYSVDDNSNGHLDNYRFFSEKQLVLSDKAPGFLDFQKIKISLCFTKKDREE
jgi:hypothetical protein